MSERSDILTPPPGRPVDAGYQLQWGDDIPTDFSFSSIEGLPTPEAPTLLNPEDYRPSPDAPPLQDWAPGLPAKSVGTLVENPNRNWTLIGPTPSDAPADDGSTTGGTISLDQPSKGAIPMIPPPEAARPGVYRSKVPGMAPAMPFPDLATLPEPPPGVLNDPILRGYTEDNFRDAVVSQSPIFAESSTFGKGSNELGQESLNRAWANREIGPEATDAEYRIWRSRKAKQYLGKDDANEKEIFDLGRKISGEIQAKAKGVQQIYGLSISQGLDDVAANQQTPMASIFGNWKAQNQALISQGNDAAYLAGAYQVAQQAQADLEPVKVPAAHAWSAIKQLAQGKATPYDMMKLGRELAARTPEERKTIYRFLVAAADANRIDRSVFDQIAQNIGKHVSQSFDFMDKGGLQRMEGEASLWLTEIGRGNVQMGNNGARRFAYEGQPNTRALTAQEKSDLEAKFKADLGAYQVIRELMALRRKGIDPVIPVAPDGTWARTAETGLYGLAGSTGPMLVVAGGSLVDPVVGFALGAEVIATDKYDDYVLDGMEPGVARRLSLVTGAVESAVNLFDLRILAGHAPGFARLLKGMEPGVGKWTLTTGMSVASANVAQGAGDLATRFIEELGTTGVVNPERFKAIVGDWAKERPAAFFQLLPAALVGGGIANFRDFKDGGRFLLTPSFLKIVGFSPEQQARLVAAHTPEDAQAIYREEFSKRTPENIAAGIGQLHTTLDQVESGQGNPSKPVLDLPRGENEWHPGSGDASNSTSAAPKANNIPQSGPTLSPEAFSKPAREVVREGEDIKKAFGRDFSDAELANLAGAPHDATVRVNCIGGMHPQLHFTVESDYVVTQERMLSRDYDDGQLVLYNKEIKKKDGVGAAYGALALLTQVKTAQRLGVTHIDTYAAGRYGDPDNIGYKVWPRRGFSADLPPSIIAALPDSLKGNTTMLKLVESSAGREWWEKNGESIYLKFNLKKGSESTRMLKSYLKEKNIGDQDL